jgi:cytochrome c553
VFPILIAGVPSRRNVHLPAGFRRRGIVRARRGTSSASGRFVGSLATVVEHGAGAMGARKGLLAMTALLMTVGPTLADDRAGEGRQKAVQCVACHGSEGIAPNPTFPHLAGQNPAYLELQLRKFRAGERYHPLMTPVAETLSDQDIDELAAYYSELRPRGEAP